MKDLAGGAVGPGGRPGRGRMRSLRPEENPVALTTVQDLLSRFRSFVDEQARGRDPNEVRMVIEC
jgi:hypothetical protein